MSILIRGNINYGKIIKCHKCNSGALSQHYMVLYCDAENAEKEINRHFEKQMPNIPVGWRMDGRNKLTCVQCTSRKPN